MQLAEYDTPLIRPVPLLSILIPCLKWREWEPLVAEFQRQIRNGFDREPAGHTTRVEILTEVDDGEYTSGVKRAALTTRATGSYVAFFDDDDWPSPDYVSSMLEGIATGADVVSFDLELTRPDRRGVEKWSYGMFPNQRNRGKMCVNHLCAWRKSIATLSGWCPRLGYGDDNVWFQPLFHLGLTLNHHHIPRVLYRYQFDPVETSNQRRERIGYARAYVGMRGLRCYNVNGVILVEDGAQTQGEIIVRDPQGRLRYLDMGKHTPYHTIRIH